ncbi:hypothetical protein EMN47_07665 [Prolixibacteraceae bacterium JC049]|nr:hypothetical protein [Prolixibacteraceae bacterium JC049]
MKNSILKFVVFVFVLSVTIIGCSDDNGAELKKDSQLLEKNDLLKKADVDVDEELVPDTTKIEGGSIQEEVLYTRKERNARR